ncbi:MAG: Ig-like domain-containing protein [Candidatus Latescibacterota bacterium]|nr:MAG: Ig-like domain-containing protein [Candidatus Latescibacterota bacterium]
MTPRLIVLLIVSVTASCAIPEPPPGGPEDKTAPEVVTTVPENGSSAVSADVEIEFGFSEKMRRAKIERLVSLSPHASIAKARWKGNTVKIEFEEPLHPDTTYIVELKPGYSDAHGVRGAGPYKFAFATSAHIDSGAVLGRVYFRREPSEKGVVRLFVLPRDSSFAPETARPDRETTTAGDGTYELTYLPTNGRRFLIWTFHDDNGNAFFESDREAGGALPDTVVLSDELSRLENQDIWIIDPREPAVITGRIENKTGNDSFLVTVTLHAVTDTVPPTYYVRCDPNGRYELDEVLKGTYTMFAFLDLSPDSVCGSYPCPEDSTLECVEPCVAYPDTLVIGPGDRVSLDVLTLDSAGATEE